MTANEIREAFVKYFEQQGHLIVPSAPMVVKDDPTLMFTNAGMNQFKDIILGNVEPKCRRQCDSQKCLRVSGKHNDLEEVGHDTYHHTMFEMLGNWSFGDYFKKEAIEWSYKFLVEVLKVDPTHLYVTVFEGSKEEGLDRDDEAAGYWEQYFPKDHIINGNKHDNFWEMGDTGPCGPCSEIHIDCRTEEERKATGIKGADLVNKDNPQVIEIWNIVFMQYERKADGHLEPLPNKVIDTGMGFERLVRVMQGKHSNYDTDVFQPYIQKIGELSGFQYGKDEKVDIAMRVISDHLRAIAFAIADGQLPSNAKAGYVIRRILRRAVRYAYTFLGQREAFICKLVPTLVREMGDFYPELPGQQQLIEKVIKEEEDSFLRTLSTGINLLENLIATSPSPSQGGESGRVLDGAKAFMLFDTYGFPLDLTQLICSENGMTVDVEGFDAEMQKQKERARNAAQVENGDWIIVREGEQAFCGYDETESEAKVLRYRSVSQKNKTFYQVVFDNTPFYGEMGGQVGDKGTLRLSGCQVEGSCLGKRHPDGMPSGQDGNLKTSEPQNLQTYPIIDAKRENGQTVHIMTKLPANMDGTFKLCLNTEARKASQCNHTATHLLDYCLRSVLGTHVEQKGSLVTPEYLRFDFSHFQKVTPEELREVERRVNAMIRENILLDEHRAMPIEDAKKLGAMALFGEKYGDKVRVVKFGPSVEFCGGCHAQATGEIGLFHIVSESSVAAGVRRIEAITGAIAEARFYEVLDALNGIRSFFNNAKDVQAAVEKAIEENAGLRKQMEDALKERIGQLKDKLISQAVTTDEGIHVVAKVIPMAVEAAAVKDLAFQIGGQMPEKTLIVLGSSCDGKPLLTVMISKDLIAPSTGSGRAPLHAGNMVKEAARLIKGGGGGAPHFATAGGKDTAGLEAAVQKCLEIAGV